VEIRDYVRVLRRSWSLVLVCVVLGGLLAAAATWRATKVYAASVTMMVSSSSDQADGAASAYQASLLSQLRVKSYAELIASDRVAAAVIRRLGLPEDPDSLRGRLDAQAVPDTVLLRATVQDPDPGRAQQIADAVGDVFSQAIERIEQPVEGKPPTVHVHVWERAKLPTGPVSPRPTRNLALGVLLGLLASIAVALLRHRLDTSIAGEEDAGAVSGIPALASIVFDPEAASRPLLVQVSPHAPRAESFRQLRTNLQFVDIDAGPRVILVTSPVPAEGKTTTSLNLAITLARSGARVCLLEGDLRRPCFAGYLGVESAAGLTSVLIGAADLDDVLQPWGEGRVGDGRIEVLPSGQVPPNPSELLGSRGMADIIDTLSARFDMVLIDAPPLLPVTDAAVLAARVDGTLLVVRIGRTRREQLRRAVEALRVVDARMIGTVLNMVPAKGATAYHYGYGYSYAPRGRHSRSAHSPWPRRKAGVPDAAGDVGVRPAVPAIPVQRPSASSALEMDEHGLVTVEIAAQRTPPDAGVAPWEDRISAEGDDAGRHPDPSRDSSKR
jgi:capsular exopolysaccharide synthesis family protein